MKPKFDKKEIDFGRFHDHINWSNDDSKIAYSKFRRGNHGSLIWDLKVYDIETEKNIKEHGSKVSDAEKKAIEDGSNALKEALKGEDIEDIKKKTETLVQASMKLGEAIYKSQQGTKPESNKDNGKDEKEEKDDNVVDADFEEVKDDNKEKSA